MEIRELTSSQDLKAVEELQRIVWGAADIDILSPLSLRASLETGALLLGAFDGAKLAGFVYAFPGYRHRQIELHSDMTGLRPEYRDRGLGYQLSFQVERMDPVVYLQMHEEFSADCRRATLGRMFDPPNRLAPAALSYLRVEPFPRSLLVYAFHTFPENCAVVKTQTLIELPSPL